MPSIEEQGKSSLIKKVASQVGMKTLQSVEAGLIFGNDATLIASSKMKEKEKSTHFKRGASRVGMKTLRSVERSRSRLRF